MDEGAFFCFASGGFFALDARLRRLGEGLGRAAGGFEVAEGAVDGEVGSPWSPWRRVFIGGGRSLCGGIVGGDSEVRATGTWQLVLGLWIVATPSYRVIISFLGSFIMVHMVE